MDKSTVSVTARLDCGLVSRIILLHRSPPRYQVAFRPLHHTCGQKNDRVSCKGQG